jgi:hypothetical protein
MKRSKPHKILSLRIRFYISWNSVTAHGHRIAVLEMEVLTEGFKLHLPLSISLANLHTVNVKESAISFLNPILFAICISTFDRLCGLVVSVLGYSSRGPGSIPGTN